MLVDIPNLIQQDARCQNSTISGNLKGGDRMMKMTQCVADQPLAPVEKSNQKKLMKTIDGASRYPFPTDWHTFSVLTSSLDII